MQWPPGRQVEASGRSTEEPGEGREGTGGPGQGTHGGALKEPSWFWMKGDSPTESPRREGAGGPWLSAEASSARSLRPPACPDHAAPSFPERPLRPPRLLLPRSGDGFLSGPRSEASARGAWSNRKHGRCLPRVNVLRQQLVGLRGRPDAESFN